MSERVQLITVGQVGSVYGVRGWLHINSFTEPSEQITHYLPWCLKSRRGVEAVEIEAVKPHAGKLIAKFVGIDDRDQAKPLVQSEIQIDVSLLPDLPEGEYYWHQLEQLKVICDFDGQQTLVGRVERLMETGANDVFVVKGTKESVDREERLIPYISDQVVKSIDLAAGEMIVNWDPQF